MSGRPTPEEREALRIRAVEAVRQGFTQSHVAAMLGISSASVSNWALRYRSGGIEELLAKPQGRPRGGQLSSKHAARVQKILKRKCPDQAGLQARLWTWRAVQALVFRCCNTEVSRWTAVRYLNSWGFRPPNPMSRLETQVAEAAEQEVANGYQAIKVSARQPGKVFYFIERTEFAPSGSSRSPDSGISILWARGARSEAAFMVVRKHGLARGMIDFFDRLVDHSGGRTCIVVINDELRRDCSTINWGDYASNGILVKGLPNEVNGG
jgi:transposase